MFERTTAVNKLLKLNKRKRIIPGGTWAGKTYDIIAIEIDHLIKNPSDDLTVVAETIPAVKEGAMKDFLDIMRETNRWNPKFMNWSNRKYTFSKGATIQFTAYDSEDKAKQAGKRKRLFINEVNTIPRPIVDALMIRTEGVIWLDYNPTASFWVDQELINDKNADWLTLTYRDNEALPSSIMEELKNRRELAKTSSYWKNWCDVYLDGKIGALQGVVYERWKQIDIIPEEARLLGYGMDFGYTNDPTAIIAVYKYNDEIILDEVCYQTGMLNNDIANVLKSKPRMMCYADSAEPKSIQEIRRHGVPVRGADKGRDSVMYGIDILQGYSLLVTKRSVNLIRELRNYVWDTDKTGEKLNKPVDAFNHGLDAVRYFAVMQLKRNVGTYDIR